MINSISKTFLPHAIMDLSNQSLPSSKGVPMYLSDYLMLAILGASFLFPSDARTIRYGSSALSMCLYVSSTVNNRFLQESSFHSFHKEDLMNKKIAASILLTCLSMGFMGAAQAFPSLLEKNEAALYTPLRHTGPAGPLPTFCPVRKK